MNQGQVKFMNYILERVKEENLEETKALLADNFKKQAEGNFTKADIAETIPRIMSMLKPDQVEEVQAVMKQFAQSVK